MRLRCKAGAYFDQVRDYGTVAGLAALRTGTAVAIDAPVVITRRAVAALVVASTPVVSHRDKSRRSK